ncbi:hypothetical protein PO124_10130 [Bacillus licheniformis]|nr:hypothetical protein [Bacillus licheniformis]
MKSAHVKGVLMVLAGASLWGLSGSAAQFVFERGAADAGSLVSVRLLASGVILLLYVSMKTDFNMCVRYGRKNRYLFDLVFPFWNAGRPIYIFASIEKGNAAAAAILQYLAPFSYCFTYMLKRTSA